MFNQQQSRWTLKAIAQTCEWLQLTTSSGLWQLLKRLKIHYKRGRSYTHSPDPEYEDKISYLDLCRMRAWYAPERYVFVYLDEISYYRQPSLANDYELSGCYQPLARRSCRSNTRFRGIGALNAITGQVIYRQYYKTTTKHLSDFYALLRETYPHAEVIYVAQDNWPVHVHPDVLARLEPQQSPFWPTVPGNWSSEPSKNAVHDNLPIQLVFLPTYASWLNPIEKLWRLLKQKHIHLHRLSDDWQGLKQLVYDFLDQFAFGSQQLLQYVGLLSV